MTIKVILHGALDKPDNVQLWLQRVMRMRTVHEFGSGKDRLSTWKTRAMEFHWKWYERPKVKVQDESA